MDETPGRGKQSKIKIATKFRYDESRKATHYHILPAAENSMLPALTAPIWAQQNGGKKQSQSEKNIQASKITGRFRFKDSGHPLQRKGSLQRRDCGCRAHVCICSGRTCDCSTKKLFLETQFNGRTYSRPETHSPRADCARFMPRFRYYGCRRRAQARFLLLGRGAQVL